MIKANELRIGNYYDQFGNIHQVNGHIISELGKAPIGQLWCKPIPLTEEILLKCGFVEKKKWFYKEKFLLGYMTTDENLQAEWKFGGVEGTWNLLNIKYVHQLQNLYFALTGEELTINL